MATFEPLHSVIKISVYPNGISDKGKFRFTLSFDPDGALPEAETTLRDYFKDFPSILKQHIEFLRKHPENINHMLKVSGFNINPDLKVTFDTFYLDQKDQSGISIGSYVWNKVVTLPGGIKNRVINNKKTNPRENSLFRSGDKITISRESMFGIEVGDQPGSKKKDSKLTAFDLDPREIYSEYLQYEFPSQTKSKEARKKQQRSTTDILQGYVRARTGLSERLQKTYEAFGLLNTNILHPDSTGENKGSVNPWELFFQSVSHLQSNFQLQRFAGLYLDFEIEPDNFIALFKPAKPGGDIISKFSLRLDAVNFFPAGSPLEGFVTHANCIISNLEFQKKTINTRSKYKVLFAPKASDFFKNSFFILNPFDRGPSASIFKFTSFNWFGKLMSNNTDRIGSLQYGHGSEIYTKELKKFLKDSSFTITNGLSLHVRDWHTSIIDHDIDTKGLFEEDVIKGQQVFAAGESKLVPMGLRSMSLNWVDGNGRSKNLLSNVPENHFIRTDTATLICQSTADNINISHIINNTIFTWIGQNLSFRSVFRHGTEESNTEPSKGASDPSIHLFNQVIRHFYFPFLKKDEEEYASLPAGNFLKFSYDADKNISPSLIFGKEYSFILSNVYRNGWSPGGDVTAGIEISRDEMIFGSGPYQRKRNPCISIPERFLRNEPVEAPYLAIKGQLEGKDKKSRNDLVVKSDSGIFETDARFIAPPRVDFNHALWYGCFFYNAQKLSNRKLARDESYQWYLKLKSADKDPGESPGIFAIEESNGNLSIPYLPDPSSDGFWLHFFHDPEMNYPVLDSSGKRLSAQVIYNGDWPDLRAYQLRLEKGSNLIPEITDDKENDTLIITIKPGSRLFCKLSSSIMPEYSGLFNSYPVIGNKRASEIDPLQVLQAAKAGELELLSPSVQLTMTYAVQKPLVQPGFYVHDKFPIRVYRNNKMVNITRDIINGKPLLRAPLNSLNEYAVNETLISDTEIIIEAFIHFEHLNAIPQARIPQLIEEKFRTGELQLLTDTEIFSDKLSKHVSPERGTYPNSPEVPFLPTTSGYLVECKIVPGENGNADGIAATTKNKNEFQKIIARVRFRFDSKDVRYVQKMLYLKNKTGFFDYYKGVPEEKLFIGGSAPVKIDVPANKKPVRPSIHAIMPLMITLTGNATGKMIGYRQVTRYGKRFRIYLDRGRLSSGRGEKIAIAVHAPAENVYKEYYQKGDHISIVGRDITTYSANPFDPVFKKNNEQVYLAVENFSKEVKFSGPGEYFKWEENKKLGIIICEPLFDRNQLLWYCDVQINVRDEKDQEIYCPIIQLSIANFQEHAINYNDLEKIPQKSFDNDMRISPFVKSHIIYLLPTRTAFLRLERKTARIKVFDLAYGTLKSIRLTDKNNPEIRSRFFAFIQKKDGDLWDVELSTNEKNEEGYFHSLDIPPFDNTKTFYSKVSIDRVLNFQSNWKDVKVGIIEVEDFTIVAGQLPSVIKDKDLLGNYNYRLVCYTEHTYELQPGT